MKKRKNTTSIMMGLLDTLPKIKSERAQWNKIANMLLAQVRSLEKSETELRLGLGLALGMLENTCQLGSGCWPSEGRHSRECKKACALKKKLWKLI